MPVKVKEYLPLVVKGTLFATETILLLFSLVFFAYHLFYARKIIPGVKVGSQVSLGGKTPEEVRALLREKEPLWSAISLTLLLPPEEGVTPKTLTLPLRELGVAWRMDKILREAYLVGRSGNLLQDLGSELHAFWKDVNIPLSYQLDEGVLATSLERITKELGQSPVDAAFSIKEGQLILSPEQSGFTFGQEDLKKAIEQVVASWPKRVTLALSEVAPQVKSSDLLPLQAQVETLLREPLLLTVGGKNFVLSPEKALAFLLFVKEKNGEIAVKVDRDGVANYLREISLEINSSPRGQILEIVDGRVAKFVPQSEGVELDRFAAANLLTKRLTESSASGDLFLPLKKLPPPPTQENAYGIRELLGEGHTNFAGSIPGRIHNIDVAAARFNGLLVPPGAVFSFNEALGEVSERTGYDQAYIISEGRTVLGTGGGVCQISSTLFRAILNAGLPVLKRTAHAYRVHYYEPPLGLDATVYAPAVDLQFRNDTPAYLLITTEVSGLDLYFRLYGTSDGRQVEMKGPYVASETPPPAPLFQEDPALPKGVKTQVDWEAWGAEVSFTRVVKRNGEILQSDAFLSRYTPWRAVYLVGTKET